MLWAASTRRMVVGVVVVVVPGPGGLFFPALMYRLPSSELRGRACSPTLRLALRLGPTSRRARARLASTCAGYEEAEQHSAFRLSSPLL